MKTNHTLLAGKGRFAPFFKLSILMLVWALTIPPLRAANSTWNGGSTVDANWATTANWVGGVAPVANDALFFNGVLNTSAANNFTANTAYNGITFNTGAAAFTLSGNAINLAGDITDNSLNAQIISLAPALTATRSVNVVSFDGALTISGLISGSTFGVTKTGSGLLTLSGANTFTGPVTISGGTLSISADGTGVAQQLGSGAAAVNLTLDGGVLRTTATTTLSVNRSVLLGDSGAGTGGTIDVTTGILTYNGVMANNGGTDKLIKTGANTLLLGGANLYTGNTALNQGTLKLDFSQTGAPTTSIINSGNTLTMGGNSTSLGFAPSSAVLAPTLNVTGKASTANSQTFGGLTLNQGNSQITTAPGASGSVLLPLGAITHTGGGVVNFTLGGTFSSGVNAITTSSGNVNGILGGWATYGGTDWAANDGSANNNIIAYASYNAVADAGTIASDATKNHKLAGAASLSASGTTDANTIQDTATTAKTIAIGSGNTLRLGSSGGIWRVSTSSTATISIGGTTLATGGTLTAGGAPSTAGEITFNAGGNNVANNVFDVFSVVADNGSSSYPVTVTKLGASELKLEAANTYSGGTYINQGRVQPVNVASFGTGTVYIQPGGQLFVGIPQNVALINNIVISGNGTTENAGFGAIRFGNLGQTIGNSSSTLTLAGDTRIGQNNGNNGIIASKITGNYNLEFTAGGNNANTSFTLSNTGNDFGGNLGINAVNLGAGLTAGNFGNNITTLKLGASEVIPNGAGKGNVIIGGGTTVGQNGTLDLNGFSETINGLVSVGTAAQARVTDNATGSSTDTLTLGDGDATATFAGIISDGSTRKVAIAKTGAGVETLSGASTYTGGTTVGGGTLRLGNANGIGANTVALIVNSGALDLNGNNITVGPLSGSGGSVINNVAAGGTATLTAGDSTSSTYSGALNDGGSGKVLALTKQNGGTLTLSGTLGYSGLTTVNGGKLVIPSSKSGTGNITVANGVTLGVTISGVSQATPATLTLGTSLATTLEFNGVTSTTIAPLAPATLTTGGTVTVNINSGTFTSGLSYPLMTWTTGSPTFSLGTVVGASGNLSVSGNTLYFNVTSVSYFWSGLGNGNWDISSVNNWTAGGSAALYADGNPVVFDSTLTGTTSVTVNQVVQPTTITVNNTNYTITSSSTKFIGGSATLTKTGTGTLTLAGGVNTNTGVVSVSGGTMSVSSLANGGAASDIGSSPSAAANLTISGGGTFQYAGTAANVDRLFTLGSSAALDASGTGALNLNNTGAAGFVDTTARTLTLTGTNTATNTIAAVIADNTGATTVTKSGAGTWVLNGVNTFGGGVNLNSGILTAGSSTAFGSAGTISFGGGTLQYSAANQVDYSARFSTAASQSYKVDNAGQNVTWATALTSSGGSLTALGAGTLTLGGNNTYSGTTTISNGVVAFNNSGAQTPGIIAGNGALQQIGGGTTTLNQANTFSGGLTVSGGTVVIANVSALGTGNLTLGGGTISSGNFMFTNNVVVTGNASYANTVDNSDPGHPGSLSGSGTLTNISAGANNRSFKWAGDISGFTGTFVDNSDSFNATIFRGATAGNWDGSHAKWVVNNARAFGLSFATGSHVAATFKLGELSGTGKVSGDNGSSFVITYEVGALNTSDTFSGTINDGGGTGGGVAALTKVGSGTLTLSGTNTYTGPTIINAGTLALSGNGSISNTTLISVISGAIFDVSGLTSYTLGSSQTISNSASATAIIGGNLNTGTSTNSVSFVDGTPAFAVTNGTLTVASNTVFRINNTGSPLAFGSHKLISKITAGNPGAVAAVSGLVPTNVVVTGAGAVFAVSLQIVGGELYLNVGATTVALVSSAQTNSRNASITFTASVQANGVTAGNATGTVQFETNGVSFGAPISLTDGMVSTNLSTLPIGTNLITAVYSGDGNYFTSSGSLNEIITNLPPVANPNTYSRNGSTTWKIKVSDLLTNAIDADGDSLILSNLSITADSITLDTNTIPGYVLYYNANLTADDSFTYKVADGYGGSSSALITLTADAKPTVFGQGSIEFHGGTPTITFAGIPGYTYNVQVSPDMTAGSWTTIYTTNLPTTVGVFQFADPSPPAPNAFYRLMWNGL